MQLLAAAAKILGEETIMEPQGRDQ
jgi:hypothetical protein